MDKTIIGKNMRDIRVAKGFSLHEIAEKMTQLTGEEYHTNALSKWERGNTCPSLLQASYLAKIFGCPVGALVQDDSALQEEQKIFYEIKEQYDKSRSALLYSASKWSGDLHTLIEFSNLCMSLSSKRYDKLLKFSISEYEEAKKTGDILPNSPVVDIQFLNDQQRRLAGVK